MATAQQLKLMWKLTSFPLVEWLLSVTVFICLTMNVLLLFESMYLGIVVLFVKLFRIKPEKKYKWKPLSVSEDPQNIDIEAGSAAFPKVLVQIPMYNEKEVYQLSIQAACDLQWPCNRIVIQVLDDSTDPIAKDLVLAECQKWKKKGINIVYEARDNRNGYKAGALRDGMKQSYVGGCEYVVIFDADFQPDPDFLLKTIPFLIHNPELALVQARWKYVNADECFMTRIQEMSLDYHFNVEQQAGSSVYAFFGFNGTAGVWRIGAINEAGGWKERTTVEDMDLAVRASLKGWKFVYLADVTVRNELPSTFKAYRFQQHRWSCGPANLFRKMFMEILTNKKVSAWKRFHVIYDFFLIRKIMAHTITFSFYCIVIPTSVLVPHVSIPKWGVLYVPLVITVLNALGTPRSVYLVVPWILFENVMSLHRTKGTIVGLFEAGRVNEWIVTAKLGGALRLKPFKQSKRRRSAIGERFHFLELLMGVYIFLCATYDVTYIRSHYFIYLYLQSLAFFVAGFGYVGTFVHNS